MPLTNYISLFADIKVRIREAQTKATLAANAQMIALYWDIGKIILEKQKLEGWSAKIIPRLSIDLKNDMPETSGFSERNLKYMLRFASEYTFVQQPVAQLEIAKNQDIAIPQQPVAELKQTVNQLDIILPQPVAKLEII